MDTQDELRELFGVDFFDRKPPSGPANNWCELCVCGHVDRFHSTTVGGIRPVPEPEETSPRGETWTKVYVLNGCIGALRARNADSDVVTSDRDLHVVTATTIPTCPCTEFRAVAKVDRPNRYFCQRVPADRSDQTRHPFVLGIKAFTTHLSKRRAALSDPSWATAEFTRRFIWYEDARRCGIAGCRETDGVFPMFVDGDRSELRCPAHR